MKETAAGSVAAGTGPGAGFSARHGSRSTNDASTGGGAATWGGSGGIKRSPGTPWMTTRRSLASCSRAIACTAAGVTLA